MKLRTILTLAVILTLSTGSAMAQSDPFGNMDTVIMVPAVVPEAGVSDQLQLDLYVYNDEELLGATAGFTWDNSKLQMDSAVASTLVDEGFDLGNFFYEDSDLSTTNANQHFLFGGATLFSTFDADATGRRLWASYYFTASGWTSTDAATIDTLTFNNGSEWLFSTSGGEVRPYWAGAVTIGTQVQPSNLVVDPTALAFSAIQFGANPDNQNITISSDNEPLTFETVEDIPWLTLSPTTGTTEQIVVASVDISGLTPGLYEDTITVTSAGADNSPVSIPVTLNIAEPPLVLETAPDTLSFTAEEDGANPAIQNFFVDEEFDRTISYSVTENSPWITTDKTDGNTPDTVGVQVDITGVAAGDYLDSIIVSSLDAANEEQVVYVALSVTPSQRELAVTPDTLFFNVEEDGPISDGQWFYVSEVGGDAIGFEVTGTNAFVNVDDSLGTTPDSVAVTVNPSSLAPGSYSYTLQVESAEAANSPQPVVVAVDVAPRVRQLVATPDALNFTATEGGANPADQTFDVEEALGDATLYLVGPTPAWISIAPGGGTTPNTETVSIDITGVTAGTYVDTIAVIGDEELLPVNGDSVIITLTVNPAANQAPILDSIADQSTDEGVQLIFGITATDPDGTTPILSATDLPTGALFVDNGDGSGTFDWTPTFDQAGVYDVWFFASDGTLSDSQLVAITVNNINRTPSFVMAPRDTTIDECGSIYYVLSASDPDGDPLMANVMPLAPNMFFEDSTELNHWNFTFRPDTTQAGTYPLTAWVTDGMDTAIVAFTILVEECVIPPECVDMILSDTAFTWFDTVGTPDNPNATLNITSSGDPFCFSISETLPEPPATFFVSDTTDCTPADVMLSYDKSGLGAGTYTAIFAVLGDSTVCDPNPQFFTVTLELIDTTTAPIDTLMVETVVGTPGSQVEVPITFINHCDFYGVNATLGWMSNMITVDSVSFAGGDLSDFDIQFASIDNDSNTVVITATEDGAGTPVPPGLGLAATMHVTISASADSGDFYAIDLGPSLIENPTFLIDCGTGVQQTLPDFVPGGVIVEDIAQFTCGYVVDTAGNPIEGATVELWPDFPGVGPDMTTMSDSTGYFQFNDVFASPYDIWAYKEGYYPGLVEQVNFGETGIMVTLTPVPSITPTNEFVFFYCGTNTWFGEVLPVGSVVEAYDPDGVHCGTWFVEEAGSYGFMPVYRDDQFTPNIDEGADPGDLIRFHVNGIEALAFGNNTWTQDRDQWEVCLEAGEFTKSCDLMAGWNLVSWSVDTESDDIETVLAPIADHVEVVMGFEQGGLAWDPALPQFSTLWMVDHFSGYWIKVDSAVTLEIAGAAVASATPIPLDAGWNLVSYLPEITLATEVALSSIENDLIVALGYDGGGLTYLPGDTLHNTLTDMAPCNGYWVKVDNAGTLTYPGPGPAVAPQNPRPLGAPVAKTAPGVTPTRSWMNLYAHNLTVDGEQVTAGTTVEAYTMDGTKIGSFSLKQNGLFGFMPVYADDPSTSDAEGVQLGESFTLSVNGVATEETFEFTGHGDKLEITGLTAKGGGETLPGTFSLSQNYPNPFNPTTTIEFSLPAAGKATIEIFNVLGKRVATVFDGPAEAGANRIEWNATDHNDQKVASGIYFYRLTADNYNETKKMILLK